MSTETTKKPKASAIAVGMKIVAPNVNPELEKQVVEEKVETVVEEKPVIEEIKGLNEILDPTNEEKEVVVDKKVETAKPEKDVVVEKKEEPSKETTKEFTDLSSVFENENEQEKKVKELEEYATRYKDIKDLVENDALVVAVLEARKNGKNNYREIVTNILGEDVNTLPDETVFKKYLTEQEYFSPDDAEAEWEEFSAKNESRQKTTLNKYRAFYEQQNIENIAKYGLTLRNEAEQRQEKIAQAAQVGLKTLEDSLSKLTGSTIDGFPVTKEMTDLLRDDVMNKLSFFDPAKGFLIKDSIEHHFYKRYGREMVKFQTDRVKNQTRNEVLEDVVKPSKNSTPTNAPVPQVNETEKASQAAQGFIQRQQEKFKAGSREITQQ